MSTSTQTTRVQVNDKTYSFLQNSNKRINVEYGSAGSGKSWSIAQYLLIDKFIAEENIRMLLTRETRPAIKKSNWLLMNDLIDKYALSGIKRNLSDLTLTHSNGNTVFFAPTDEIEKFKSFENLNYVWVEEATELSYHEYLQLNLRCRGVNVNGINKLFFSFNPVDENSFWKDITENPPGDVAILHSTYHDNAFLNPEEKRQIENLKEQDPTYWKIYGEGVWATPENIIYTNWKVSHRWPLSFDEVIYGVDFGTTNPSAVIEIGILDQALYMRELLYETGLTPSMFMERLERLEIPYDCSVYADSAMPGMITDMENAGYCVYPSKKGQNSVFEGIRLCQGKRVFVDDESPNLEKELRAYKWREDRNGNVVDGQPVKFRDHLMDAWRYAAFTHLGDREEVRIWAL